MNQNETIIRKLVDSILLNACSVNLSGLYNGKAGMALALFEASRYLQDEYVESHAYDLLKESLITKTKNISFEDGLSGIGYVLLYLLKNHFIEADFEDIFGNQHQRILLSIDSLKDKENAVRLPYYLTEVKAYTSDFDTIKSNMETIFLSIERDLLSLFTSFMDVLDYKAKSKAWILSKFESYLKTVCDCNYTGYSRSLLEKYAELYRAGRLRSSLPVAYYLDALDLNDAYSDIIKANKQFSQYSNLLHGITLRKLLEYSQLDENPNIIKGFFSGIGLDSEIIRLVPQDAFVAGYENGLSRLMIYLTNKHANLL